VNRANPSAARCGIGLTLIWLTLASAAARAATAQTLGPEWRDAQNFGGDIREVMLSPLHADHRDIAPVGAALGAVALTSRLDSAIYHWMTTHDRSAVMRLINPVREGAKINVFEAGSGQYLLPLSGALYVSGRLSRSADLRDAGLGCAAGHLTSLGLRLLTYGGIRRDRPRVTSSPSHVGIPGTRVFHIAIPGTAEWNEQSFFSGHIANSMACASFISHRYSLGIVEPVAFAYSGAIGLGRMADGEHWASDTMTGAIVGFAIGKALADRQLVRKASAATNGALAARRGPRIPLLRWSFEF